MFYKVTNTEHNFPYLSIVIECEIAVCLFCCSRSQLYTTFFRMFMYTFSFIFLSNSRAKHICSENALNIIPSITNKLFDKCIHWYSSVCVLLKQIQNYFLNLINLK